jgi:hypothetical protein
MSASCLEWYRHAKFGDLIGDGMAGDGAGLPLADFIGALRSELRSAALARDAELQFNVGPVTVELTVMTRHEGGGKAGVRFWVVEVGASASAAHESTQKVTLELTPVSASGEPWQVADEVEERPS